ncbi:Major Facilitator Superfamily [Rhizoctonia solani]|uniref:Major Facilitator Superfamily n=1 Tax=Rhizoctonia solani TaxID=456999 RepID=A0A8H7M6J4_9AGAM|nr:Major Facilitator Superfamily [Rhizoctonia solani]
MASSIEKQDPQLGPESDKNWAHDHNQDHTLKPAGVLLTFSNWSESSSIGLAAYTYSLDGSTTWTYLAFAGSALNNHSLIATVQVVQSIIVACGKPFIAKLADSLSRPVAYSLVVFFYVLGYIIIASAQNIATVAGGIVIYAVGYTGLQLLLQIIIADTTTLKWRGLSSGLVSAPFIINAFAGSEVSASVMASGGPSWRWGYGMFAILVPHKAKSQGLVEPAPQSSARGMNKFKAVWEEVDMLGLLILAGGVACVLLPLTLAKSAKGGWANPSMITMLTVGPIFFIAFGIYEWKFAAYPIVPMRFLRNKAVVGAALIGFFDFGASVPQLFLLNTKVALTVFGIIAGAIMRTTHRYKWMLVTGLFIRLFGVGLMIHSRGAKGNTGELVMTQVIQGLGGGFAAVASQVSAKHQNTMPRQLEIHLPDVNSTVRAELFSSITTIAGYPPGTRLGKA